MNSPKVLTIILNYRTPEMTLQAVEYAIRELSPVGGEVLVIDNGSGDGSYDILEKEALARGWLEHGVVRVQASNRNGGFGAGMNIGFAAHMSDGTRPDFFHLLNSDATPDPTSIEALVDHMIAHPRAGVAGSYIHGPDGTPHPTAFRYPSIAGEFESGAYTGVISRLLSHAITALPIPETAGSVPWTAGASLMVRRSLIEEIGGFDETLFLYFEDTDLCRRAADAGWDIHFVPQSRVTHIGSVSTGMKTWERTPQYWFDSRLHYFTKTHGRFYAGLATFARAAGGCIWRIRRLVGGKTLNDPPYFLRDLIKHYFRSIGQKPMPVSVISERPEEQK